MARPIYVLNGPNLNRLGTREPAVYGTTTLAQIEALCRTAARPRPVEFRQTNAEHQLVDWIHEAIDHGDGIVVNPAGLTFTSIPVVDALKMFAGPIFEVHLSNVHRREAMYHRSLVSPVATSVLIGLGADGYRVAIEAMIRRLEAG